MDQVGDDKKTYVKAYTWFGIACVSIVIWWSVLELVWI